VGRVIGGGVGHGVQRDKPCSFVRHGWRSVHVGRVICGGVGHRDPREEPCSLFGMHGGQFTGLATFVTQKSRRWLSNRVVGRDEPNIDQILRAVRRFGRAGICRNVNVPHRADLFGI